MGMSHAKLRDVWLTVTKALRVRNGITITTVKKSHTAKFEKLIFAVFCDFENLKIK